MDLLKHGYDMNSILFVYMILILPWIFKAFLAMMLDMNGITSFIRSNSIFGCNIGILKCLLMLTFWNYDVLYIPTLLFLNIILAILDTQLDGIVTVITKNEKEKDFGKFQSQVGVAREMGATIGEILGPLFYHYFESSGTYLLLFIYQVVNLTFSMIFVLEVNEGEKISNTEISTKISFLDLFSKVKKTLAISYVFPLWLFFFFYALIPNTSIPLFYLMTGPLNISAFEISLMSFCSGVARMLAIIAAKILYPVPLNISYPIFGIFTTISVAILFLLLKLFSKDQLIEYFERNENVCLDLNNLDYNLKYSLTDMLCLNNLSILIWSDLFYSVFTIFKLMPIIIIISLVSDHGAESSTISTTMSIINTGFACQKIISMLLCQYLDLTVDNFDNIYMYFFIVLILEMTYVFISIVIIPRLSVNDIKKLHSS